MSQVFHKIEKQIIEFLQKNPTSSLSAIRKGTGLSEDQTRRGIEWLRHKELVQVNAQLDRFVRLGKNGLESLQIGLPETELMQYVVESPQSIESLQEKLSYRCGPAIQNAKRQNWITFSHRHDPQTNTDDTFIIPTESYTHTHEHPSQKILVTIGKKTIPIKNFSQTELDTIESLHSRPDFIIYDDKKSQLIVLEVKARKIKVDTKSTSAINVEADVPQVFVAKIHPLQDTINEIREIFVTLGFSEILGNLSQPCFWNFDALFTPQDHPARELQDTFYLDGFISKKIGTSKQIQQVSKMHKNGWKYLWSIDEARKMVLRTHTTCVTIKHLADNKPDEARVFSLGRVFRNEKVSYKHLVEFNQVEGIVVGKNTTLRDLMGIQREFYRRMGLDKVKFWPTFFPYTEPSLQSMVYNERSDKWVELFGMGIFRPEVTKPLGITKPVLAWGGGIERIAMLKYGLDDVREFYNNNLKWLRSVTKCQ